MENFIKEVNSGKYNELQLFQLKQVSTLRPKLRNLDLLANPNPTNFQMEQIRLGINDGLDVSVYSKEEFNPE